MSTQLVAPRRDTALKKSQMKGSRFSEEPIISTLRDQEGGLSVVDLRRALAAGARTINGR